MSAKKPTIANNQAGKIALPHGPLGLGPGFPAGPLRFLINHNLPSW
jgi:hypothetical protein